MNDLDPELAREFDTQRKNHEAARRLQEEEAARLRADLTKTAERMADDERRRAAERFDSALRAAFFVANPTATDADWERLKPQIRDAHMTNAAAQTTTNVFDRIRADAERRQQEERDRQARFEQLPQGA
jgi:hypothetical protein